MKILALETVGRTGSVAALVDQSVLNETVLDAQRRGAQTLAPAIAELLATVGWSPRDVRLVAVATGPGSFTGLRIGVTTAKAFAYAAGCAIVGVPTLAAIAERTPRTAPQVTAVLNAERGELFVADFQRDPSGEIVIHDDVRIERAETWSAGLLPGQYVVGPGLESIAELLPRGVLVAPRDLWLPAASAVGRLGLRLASRGCTSDAFSLLPSYGRKTAAEERATR